VTGTKPSLTLTTTRLSLNGHLDRLAPHPGTISHNIKSDRGTWPDDVAATSRWATVRTPCDGGCMSRIRPPKNCGLFKPGHIPHWIQINRAGEDTGNPPTPGRLVESRRDGTLVVEVDGHELLLWNHESERLAETASASGGEVEYQPRWGLLWVPSTGGRYAFCVAPSPDNHVPCPLRPPVGSPVELLESAGGFTIPAVTTGNRGSGGAPEGNGTSRQEP
jgi:hypothetical protein